MNTDPINPAQLKWLTECLPKLRVFESRERLKAMLRSAAVQ
jgi:hypothetical protein